MLQHVRTDISLKLNIFKVFTFFWRIFGVFPLVTEKTSSNRYKVATKSTLLIIAIHITILSICWYKVNVLDSALPTTQLFESKQRDNISLFWSELTFVLYFCQLCFHFVAPFIFRQQYCQFVNTLCEITERLTALNIEVKLDRPSAIKFVLFSTTIGVLSILDMISSTKLSFFNSSGQQDPTFAMFILMFAGYFYAFVTPVHLMFYLYTMKAYIDTVSRVIETFQMAK
jgi:hypothetical protein